MARMNMTSLRTRQSNHHLLQAKPHRPFAALSNKPRRSVPGCDLHPLPIATPASAAHYR